jgi:peptide-methionine (S)-S-oxide reductase
MTTIEKVTLGGGCFWCLEAVYDELKGVTDVESGYSNGNTPNPTYEAVCTGRTGYAEVVQLTYDTSVISFQDILNVFFTIHDPTTLNRQGADKGTQYRSGVYYHTDAQRDIALATIDRMNAEKVWSDPIVTEVKPLERYSTAEDYHQEYFAHHPNQGYCQFVIAPKVAKFRKYYFEQLKA